jgi:hypothetical protein
MSTRRNLIASVGGIASAGTIALFGYTGSGAGGDVETGSNGKQGPDYQSGIKKYPDTDAFQIMNLRTAGRTDSEPRGNILLQLKISEADSVDTVIVLTEEGSEIHREQIFESGNQIISFDGGDATMFKLEARSGESLVGTATFYSKKG